MPFYQSVVPKNISKNVFVETGTYKGDGVNNALRLGFKNVHSIELDNTLFNQCKKKFSNHSNVTIYHGDSGIVLKDVMDKVSEPVTLFLDAHYCGIGSKTGLGSVWIPIEKEMEVLKNHFIKTHVIVIDDLSAMDNSHYDLNSKKWAGSPGLEFILNSLVEINPNYNINIYRKENQIVAVPTENENAIEHKERILMELYKSRVTEKKKIINELMRKLNVESNKYDVMNETTPDMEELEKVKIELSKMLV